MQIRSSGKNDSISPSEISPAVLVPVGRPVLSTAGHEEGSLNTAVRNTALGPGEDSGASEL